MPEFKCESLNHPKTECYGPLSRCRRCLNVHCMAEGVDGVGSEAVNPELCDGCFDAEMEALAAKG